MEIFDVLSHPRLDLNPSRENQNLWCLFDKNTTTQTEGCWHISVSSFLNILRTPITVEKPCCLRGGLGREPGIVRVFLKRFSLEGKGEVRRSARWEGEMTVLDEGCIAFP